MEKKTRPTSETLELMAQFMRYKEYDEVSEKIRYRQTPSRSAPDEEIRMRVMASIMGNLIDAKLLDVTEDIWTEESGHLSISLEKMEEMLMILRGDINKKP